MYAQDMPATSSAAKMHSDRCQWPHADRTQWVLGSSADRLSTTRLTACLRFPHQAGSKRIRQTRRLAHCYLGIERGRRQGQVAFDDRDERQHCHSDRTDA